MNNQSTIIIGGMGGLFTGTFLAKNGLKVTVLKKNTAYGVVLQHFSRHRKSFETGMHVMGGFENDGWLAKIRNYLGVLDNLNVQYIPSECMDEIIYSHNSTRYTIASGRGDFVRSVAVRSPQEKEGSQTYVNKLFELTEELLLFYLEESPKEILPHSEMFTWSEDKLISHYVKDEKLQELLAYLNPLYGGLKGYAPAYIRALINTLFISGISRFEGGSQKFADALKNVIEKFGGQVHFNKKVADIHVQNVNLHGTCGVPVTAIHTAEAILRHNNFVKAINDAYKTK